MSADGFAVIDFETTGFSPEHHHRILEVGVVHVDPSGEIEGRWETLVNPERDLGPTHVHGIRGREAMQAPRFGNIAPDLVRLLSNRVVVAHNASFEARFLRAELQRLGAASPIANDGALCTMRLAREFLPGSGRSLADCCAAYDIDLENAHEAAVDADATARLLSAYLGEDRAHPVWRRFQALAEQQDWPALSAERAAWVPRARTATPTPRSFLQQSTALMPEVLPFEPMDRARSDAQQDYLASLDEALSDGVLSVQEADALRDLSIELGIGERTRYRLHLRYFDDLVRAVWADGVLTPDERTDVLHVSTLLDIPEDLIADALNRELVAPAAVPVSIAAETGEPVLDSGSGVVLSAGDHVVLTGELAKPRAHYETLLREAGFVPWNGVTKKVKLLVAADTDSLSGKARKARQYGIPIVSEAEFLDVLTRQAGS